MTDQPRVYFTLPDGRRLSLPFLPNLAEFQLPGNFRAYPQQGAFALYDGDTRTGAVYLVDEQAWRLVQPVLREPFWEFVEAQLRLRPMLDEVHRVAALIHSTTGGAEHG